MSKYSLKAFETVSWPHKLLPSFLKTFGLSEKHFLSAWRYHMYRTLCVHFIQAQPKQCLNISLGSIVCLLNVFLFQILPQISGNSRNTECRRVLVGVTVWSDTDYQVNLGNQRRTNVIKPTDVDATFISSKRNLLFRCSKSSSGRFVHLSNFPTSDNTSNTVLHIQSDVSKKSHFLSVKSSVWFL